jgi:hypothetical protein
MGLSKTQIERNAFVRGLITEASPLTFPENASIDESNFVLNRDGSRQRRLGMDFESLYALEHTGYNALTFGTAAITTFKWDNVKNDPTISLGVIQIGSKLWFVDLFKSTLSVNLKNNGNGYSLGTTGDEPCDFAAIEGKLIVASKELNDPIILTYDDSTDSFTQTSIDLKVRDIWGVDDSLAVDNRPSTLSNLHNYNLQNQGWTSARISSFQSSQSSYPSNADIVHFGKKDDGSFDASLIVGSYLGTTPAARGKFIIDAFNRGADRATSTSITGLPTDSDSGKITTIAAYAGRMFYSGIQSTVTGKDAVSPNYAGTIFYTQTIESDVHFNRCYQDADPTSEDISDLVATDGGSIKIPEAGQILKLVVKDSSLVVIADNGVWEITGPDGVFKATEYSVSKITNIGCSGRDSVVVAEGNVIYWSDAGIYLLTSGEVSGMLEAKNLTEGSIQKLYNEIPAVARSNTKGHFDASGRVVSYLYNDTAGYDGITFKYSYNKELRFDLVLQAFYIFDIKDTVVDSPYVAGYMPTQVFNTNSYENPVVVNGTQVQANGVDVSITDLVRSRGVSQTKYLVYKYDSASNDYDFSFSEYINSDFEDWGEVDAAAYLLTGYELFQDTQRQKGVNYLTMHFNRTEMEAINQGGLIIPDNPSQCWVQAQWSFADSAAAMKYGTDFQAYRLKQMHYPTTAGYFDYGMSVVTTKSKLRGHGSTISLRLRSEPGYDCYILGWGLDIDGQTVV